MSLAKLKKGDSVILHMFTGIAVSVTEIVAADEKTITITKKDGTKAKFSRKTGKQVQPKAKNERFANYITEDDGSYDPSARTAPPKKAPAKGKKATKAAPAEDDEGEEEQEETPKKKSKATAPAKKGKKAPKVEEPEEEDDDEEYEEEE